MKNQHINLVAADMGYGHQRPAQALSHLSAGEVITINNYDGIPDWEREYWEKSLESYEKISRLKKVPVLGQVVFSIMDAFQKIKPLYPSRDLSRPTIQQHYFYSFIKKGLGADLIKKIDSIKKPFVTTFFVAAQMAEYHNYSGDIYCVVCDTDASRAWAPLNPKGSRIKYFLPSEKVKERFMMYGLKEENLFVTGFPLPKENVGENKEIIKDNLIRRIIKLDPEKKYQTEYESLIKSILPDLKNYKDYKILQEKPLVITFAVGGAGAQKEIGAEILKSLALDIKRGQIFLNLVAGSRSEVRDYFLERIEEIALSDGKGVKVIFAETKIEYFELFNKVLQETDILWTKPSELSFFCALGLPIIISEPVGSQEVFNREWILAMGAGIDSLEISYSDEWLPDILKSGRFARAAMDGFLNAESKGVYNIEKVLGLE
ncbi:hypothetical protein GW758_02225 [Candidatus Falkowbacteria bacterium]|nr:hypothetical protein [Candidatus Falkowbacteria bacterium]NCT54756.1 hypothetical protein [Candidatus Falkowbacteria bacterium]